MTQITGTRTTTAPWTPTDTLDEYPTHLSEYGKGGFHEAANQAAREAIPAARRKEGMLVHQIDDDSYWDLSGGIDNVNWTPANFGGSGTIGGSTGASDNALLLADGTGGSTLKSSDITFNGSTMTRAGDLSLVASSGNFGVSGDNVSVASVDSVNVVAGTGAVNFDVTTGNEFWVGDSATLGGANTYGLAIFENSGSNDLRMFASESTSTEGSQATLGTASDIVSGGSAFQVNVSDGTESSSMTLFADGEGSTSVEIRSTDAVMISGHNEVLNGTGLTAYEYARFYDNNHADDFFSIGGADDTVGGTHFAHLLGNSYPSGSGASKTMLFGNISLDPTTGFPLDAESSYINSAELDMSLICGTGRINIVSSVNISSGLQTADMTGDSPDLYIATKKFVEDNLLIGHTNLVSDSPSAVVALGDQAGTGAVAQSSNAVAIGVRAGNTSQGISAVAIGFNAGQDAQIDNGIAIGNNAGQYSRPSSANTVAIGTSAGKGTSSGIGGQLNYSIAIGYQAGMTTQQARSVAIGNEAGMTDQDGYTVAIGHQAGQTNQGASCVAIGPNAGRQNQGSESIIINANVLDGANVGDIISVSQYDIILNTGTTGDPAGNQLKVDSTGLTINGNTMATKSEVDDKSGLPQGTIATPPTGLSIGDPWLDTTDSATHPVMRVALVAT